MDLIIVESPTKARTITKFLSGDYNVLATTGHLKDLPKSKLGVDIENNFKPDYIVVKGREKSIEEMVNSAKKNAIHEEVENLTTFELGDSQKLPFEDEFFDVVINECAVGIPDDSQKVLNEMVRVAKKGSTITIHESTWRKKLTEDEKNEISERYGTTPLEYEEWINMLNKAGVDEIITELEEWSKPEMFWKIRRDREVKSFADIYTRKELAALIGKVSNKYGEKGVKIALDNQKIFTKTVLDGKLGYCLYKGIKK